MSLKDYKTEELLEELVSRGIDPDEIRFKMGKVEDIKWNDLTLVYSLQTTEFTKKTYLVIAPFCKGEFCYDIIGPEVAKILPSFLVEQEECIFEAKGDPEKNIKRLQELGFKMKRDDTFFDW